MFALLVSPVSQLPTMVNTQSPNFAALQLAGYKVEAEGSKKNVERKYEQLMEQFDNELELNDNDND